MIMMHDDIRRNMAVDDEMASTQDTKARIGIF